VAHQRTEVALRRGPHPVVMVAHQALRAHLGLEALATQQRHVEEGLAVGVVQEDRRPPVAAGS
jgi:hypothetical protein